MTSANDELRLIADSVARLFADRVDRHSRERAGAGVFDHGLWGHVLDAGLPLLLATEPAGGLGLDLQAAYPVWHGLGRYQVPVPLAETMLAAQLLSWAGLPLPDLASGPLSLFEAGPGRALQTRDDAGTLVLDGLVHHVPWARHAQAVLVSLPATADRPPRLALLPLRDHPGVDVQPHTNRAGEPSDTLVLNAVRCAAAVVNTQPLPQPVRTLGAAARCAMMVGALESALEQSVRHAGERVQFGKPIGSNQAIQHPLALMAGDVAAARMATQVAVADLSAAACPGDGAVPAAQAARFSTAVAKVRCGEAATRGSAIAHQVHGAIGFTNEHALHFATARLWAWRDEFGSDAWWAGELGRAAIAEGSAGFWPALTDKRFAAL